MAPRRFLQKRRLRSAFNLVTKSKNGVRSPYMFEFKSGKEPFTSGGLPSDFNLESFWNWTRPLDLLSSLAPERLAEFLVAKSLSISRYEPADNFNGFELITAGGVKLEIKLRLAQAGIKRSRLDMIRFDFTEAIGRPDSQRCFDRTPKAHPDLFVFSFITHQKSRRPDPMNLDNWSFSVFSAQELTNRMSMGSQAASVTARELYARGCQPTAYRDLAYAIIDEALCADFTRLVETPCETTLQVGVPVHFASPHSELTWSSVRKWAGRPGPREIQSERAKLLSNQGFFSHCLACGVRHNRGYLDPNRLCLSCAALRIV